MTKVIFKVGEDQSPMAFGSKNTGQVVKRKRYIPILYNGVKGCSYCGSDKKMEEAKDKDGTINLICTECHMGID